MPTIARDTLRRAAPFGAAATAAALYTLACPPYDLSLLAWFAPGLLLVPARRATLPIAFGCGLAFGMLIAFGITGWAFHATLQYFAFDRAAAAGFVVLVWLVYAGLPYGLLALSYAACARRLSGLARVATGAWLWVACEMLRTNLAVGMPWELLAHTQWLNLPILQIADVGGALAISFVVAFVGISIAELIADPRPAITRRLPRIAAPVALLLATLAYDSLARAVHSDREAGEQRVVAIVQNNVPNSFRWKRAFFERTLASYARLTAGAKHGTQPPELIVWPENAVSFYVDREPMLRSQLGDVAARAGTSLLLGAPRLPDERSARNSAYLIDAGRTIRGTYDKRRLVPFAEYDPLAADPDSSPDPDAIAYTPGGVPSVLEAGRLRVGTMICYEVLFPQLARDAVRAGADVLVNLSNDTWLDAGDGAARQQHFSMSVFRAIETRRPLVRAAASGISGFVSPYGKAYSLLPAETAGVAVAPVVPGIGETPYVRWGDTWVWLSGVLVVFALLRGKREA